MQHHSAARKGGLRVTQAQSSVTIYGIADAGFVRETGGPAGKVNKISSGVGSGSRIGFKGREDLA